MSTFLYASDELVTELLYPEEQGAQADLTQAAARRFEKADAELCDVIAQLNNIIAERGTLGHQVYYGMMSLITRNRIDEMRILGGGLLPPG